MVRCFLTTFDNPYNPYEQFEQWYQYDMDHGYNSSGLLMRLAHDLFISSQTMKMPTKLRKQSIKSWQTIQLTSTRSSKSRSRTIPAMYKVLKAIGRGLKIDTPLSNRAGL